MTAELRALGKHITIETAGTVDLDAECDLWSISPKLSNSTPIGFTTDEWVRNHDLRRHKPEIVQRLIESSDYQLKFVVGSILDAEEVLEYLKELSGWERTNVMMMPRGTTQRSYIFRIRGLLIGAETTDFDFAIDSIFIGSVTLAVPD